MAINRKENFISRRQNVFYTLSLFFNTFAFGISVQIYGATMVDLSKIYSVSQTRMTQLYMANSIGYAIGTLAGLSYKFLNRQLIVSIFTLIIALTTSMLPIYRPLWLAFVMFTAQGVGLGVYGSSYQIWYIEMWPKRSTTVLQVDRFMYGLGSVMAPTLASHFVYGADANVSVDTRIRSLIVPYVIAGLIQAIASTDLLILFFTSRYQMIRKPPTNLLTSLDETTALKINPAKHKHFNYIESKLISSRRVKLTLCGIFLAVYYSSENGYLPYATSMWQYLPVKLSGPKAAKVQSVLSIFYTIGPLVTSFVSLRLAPDYIIAYHYVILMLGFFVLFIGQMNTTAIYTGSAILGYSFSAMTPAIFAFVNRHFKLTDKVTSIYLFVSGSAFVLISAFMVYFPLDDYPQILFYLLLSYLCGSLVLFVFIVKLWIRFKPL